MGVNLNWGMASQPTNYSNALLSGMQAGRQVAQQQHSDNALATYQQNPDAPGAINALSAVDPQRASAMLQVRQAQQDAADKQTQRTAAKGMYGPDGNIKSGAVADYITTTGDMHGAASLQTLIASGSKEKRAQAAESSGAIAAAGNQIAQLPYEQRKAALLQMAPTLAQHGVTPDMLQNFDPTDGNISTAVNQSIGLKAALDRSDSVEEDQFDHEKFAETKRHNVVDEGNAGAGLSIRRGALAVAQGGLGIRQAKASAGGKADAPTPPASPYQGASVSDLLAQARGN